MTQSRALSARAPAHVVLGRRGKGAVGVALWAALIVSAWLLGTRLLDRPEPDMDLHAPPLFGHFEVDLSAGVLLPLLTAAVALWSLRRWQRLPWPRFLGVAYALALLWTVSLAASDGLGALAAPLNHPADYLAAIPIDSPSSFLDGFVDRSEAMPLHVRAHPPGPVLLLAGLEAIGLGGAGVAATIVIAIGVSAVPAVLIALRAIAGNDRAVGVAPFVVLAPAALWVATSMDALFLGAGAWAVTALIVSVGRGDGRGRLFAFGGGVLFGVCLFLSYGIGLLAVAPIAVALVRRRPGPLLLAAAGCLLVFAAFAAAGFWWFEGLAATVRHYRTGISRFRPDDFFLLSNIAALAVALGPAAAAGLATMTRNRGGWLLIAAALTAVLAANLSGLSKGEVERIWLPFMPWLLLAANPSDKTIVPWCCAQAGWAILIQAGVQTPW